MNEKEVADKINRIAEEYQKEHGDNRLSDLLYFVKSAINNDETEKLLEYIVRMPIR